MSSFNLPDGCPEYLDRPLGWDDENPPELTDAELEAEYLERIEELAADAPTNVFHECAAPVAVPTLSEGQWTELEAFMEALTPDDLYHLMETATNMVEGLYRRSPSPRKPATIDYVQLGYTLATRRSA